MTYIFYTNHADEPALRSHKEQLMIAS